MLDDPTDIFAVKLYPYEFGRVYGTSATYITNGQRMTARFPDVLTEMEVKRRINDARTRLLVYQHRGPNGFP